MQASNCPNCNHLLSETYNFCPICSQTTQVHRFTIKHLLHEFFHAFTHTDKGIFFLVKGLVTKPSVVVSEYIDGKRKKYFNPFTFFLLCIGFFVFVNVTLKPNGEEPKVDPTILASIPSPKGKAMYIKGMERAATVQNITQKNSNLLALVALPINAFMFWIFFRRKQRNYAEFIIAMIFLGGFSNLLFSVIITPLMSFTRLPYPSLYWSILVAGLLLQAIYVSWGIRGLLNAKVKTSYWPVLLVSCLSNIIWALGSALFFIWFVARERTGMILSHIWHQLVG